MNININPSRYNAAPRFRGVSESAADFRDTVNNVFEDDDKVTKKELETGVAAGVVGTGAYAATKYAKNATKQVENVTKVANSGSKFAKATAKELKTKGQIVEKSVISLERFAAKISKFPLGKYVAKAINNKAVKGTLKALGGIGAAGLVAVQVIGTFTQGSKMLEGASNKKAA